MPKINFEEKIVAKCVFTFFVTKTHEKHTTEVYKKQETVTTKSDMIR